MLGKLVREWIVVIVGLCLVLPLFYIASLPAQQTQVSAPPTNRAQSESRNNDTQAKPPSVAQEKAGTQRSASAAQLSPKLQPTQSAPPSAHDQPGPQGSQPAGAPAQVPPQTPSGNQTSAAAPLNIKGDVAAGRQVFRKC